jgi:hypothetical protein
VADDEDRELDDSEAHDTIDDAAETLDESAGEVEDSDGEKVEPISIDNPDVVGTARRRYGAGGAALAAGMFGLDQALTGKQKPDSVQIQESPSDPVDVDKDGFQLTIDEVTSVEAPALERRPPLVLNKKRRRR